MSKIKENISEKEEETLQKMSARVHCETCGTRFVTNVVVPKTGIKKGEKTKTQCKACLKKKVTACLIFDRPY